ncbi:hypothetical protein GGH99_006509, partial [Coemansia sp. RSA 1285]
MAPRQATRAVAQSQVSTEDAQATISQPAAESKPPAPPQPANPDEGLLWHAVYRGDYVTAKEFIESKGLSPESKDPNGNSVLHVAVLSDSMGLVRYLVEERHVDVNMR